MPLNKGSEVLNRTKDSLRNPEPKISTCPGTKSEGTKGWCGKLCDNGDLQTIRLLLASITSAYKTTHPRGSIQSGNGTAFKRTHLLWSGVARGGAVCLKP